VLITNEFHKFCWSTILGISDDGKASYVPKSMHIFNMSKIRHSHKKYDTRGWCGTKFEPNWVKVGSASQGLASFQTLLCQCVKKGWRTGHQMLKVGAAMKLGRPATLAGRSAWQVLPPEPHFQPKRQLNPPINTPVLLPEDVWRKWDLASYSAPKFILYRVEREVRFWGPEDFPACQESSE
jgi:hypothetical protein